MDDLTHILEKILYLISSSLYLPVLLAVTGLAAYSVYALGRFMQEWNARRRNGAAVIGRFRRGLQELKVRSGQDDAVLEIEIERLLQEEELKLLRRLDQIRFVIKLGPALGLMGTLIPMGISLAALAQGNIPQMAGSMVTAFTATVTGLGCGVLAYLIALVREQWLRADFTALRHLSELAASRLLSDEFEPDTEEDLHALPATHSLQP